MIILLQSFLISCGTLQGTKQSLALQTQDAKEYTLLHQESNGVYTTLGSVPGIYTLQREKHPSYFLKQENGQIQPYLLEPKLRWSGSIFPNLLLLTYSIFGWGIDYVSGAIWELTPQEQAFPLPVGIEGERKKLSLQNLKKPETRMALTPPFFPESAETSFLIYQKLPLILKQKYPKAFLLDIENSYKSMTVHGWSHSYKPNFNENLELATALNLRYIVNTTVKKGPTSSPETTNYQVHFQVVDLAQDLTVDEWMENIQVQNQNDRAIILHRFSSLLPNTIGLGLSKKEGSFVFKDSTTNSFGGQNIFTSESQDIGLIPGSNISLYMTNVDHFHDRPQTKAKFLWKTRIELDHWKYSVTPSLLNDGPWQNTPLTYESFSSGLGLGPEIGLETPICYLYLHVAPQVSLSQYQYFNHQGSGSYWSADLNTYAEVGISFFLMSPLYFRISSSVKSAPESERSKILSKTIDRPTNSDFASSETTAFFSLEYFFPESRVLFPKFLQ